MCKDSDLLGCVMKAPSPHLPGMGASLAEAKGKGQKEPPDKKLGTGFLWLFFGGKNSRIDILKWMGVGIQM